jgi:alpha-ketoglutarate-dependent taurine dioxygenase
MDEVRRDGPVLNRFKRVQPKVVSVSGMDLTKWHLLPGKTMPLIIEPNMPEVDLLEWAKNSRAWLEKKLSVYGALLFRGFGVRSAVDFERVGTSLVGDLYGDYGDLPRQIEADKIYSSTPYPSDKTILFHNESSHTPRWPAKQLFCCIQNSVTGGETPLVDCRQVYERLEPQLRDRFEERGLLYLRSFTEGLDVSWKEFFRTDVRSEVERKCRESEIGYQWIGADDLRISQRAPAVLTHPKTGEKVFFNQVQLHHSSCLEPEVRASLTSLFIEEQLPRDVRYGDGMPIEDSVISRILHLYWDLAVSAPWEEGDVLMLDNMLVAHARNPYEGPRKILVAMGEMVDLASL